ncbi:hypothetical protein [Nocardia sp. SYP-A9097]|uniref:hypothetical protein n=1 Tax=Nocardia sp. SYP-A9097 TaxID=2663237 RepID=UPI0028155511|nr:hypothetical protein [Nocardia sp. SYP-A9097]
MSVTSSPEPAKFPFAARSAATQAVRDCAGFGWAVEATSEGVQLVTDHRIAAVELTGPLATAVRRFLRANNLSGPVIEIRDSQRREIHLVVGAAKAAKAIAMLRDAGAIVHTDGATVPLPVAGGATGWGIAPGESRWVPPLVAIAAAVRAAVTNDRAHFRSVAC